MSTILKTIAAAALIAPVLVRPVYAGDANSYPRIVGSGENASVEYGPGPMNNIVGGGHAIATGSGENVEIHYTDITHVQRSPDGMVPTLLGAGENTEVVWVPAPDGAWSTTFTRAAGR